jgi:N-acetyl-gamma-glutamyl-phosphate reductase
MSQNDAHQRIDVALVGATGYAGQELVRILARHPRVNLTAALGSASMEAPRKLPALARIWDGEVLPYAPERIAPSVKAVFLALPEANAAETAPALLARGIKVIDLSGAFRLRDDAVRAKHYPKTAALPPGTVYGLAELDRSAMASASLISCPGCYPTAALIGLGPLEGLLEGDVIVDAKSGVSGAGKAPTERTHFSENHGSVAAYGLFSHRHTPEIEQALGGRPVTFVPHLVPLDRGILETIYARVRKGTTAAQVAERFDAAYREAAFVRVTGDRLPEIKHVAHTNFCDVGWKLDEATGRLIVVVCLDNLVKGAAGQAVQNFNLAFGLDERTGLL